MRATKLLATVTLLFAMNFHGGDGSTAEATDGK